MHAAPSADPTRTPSTDFSGPGRATTSARQALTRVRPFQLAIPCLVVILVAWIAMWVGPWDEVALASLGIGFGGLLACRLPLPRRAEWALSWCMTASFLNALASVANVSSAAIEPSAALVIVAAVVFLALAVPTVVAFVTAMRAIAEAAGATASIDGWRRAQRWYLGALGAVVLLVLLSLPFATQTAPARYELNEAPGAFVMLAALVLLGAMVYAIVLLVGLLLHLRRTFGLQGLVERGHLVLRQDAWGPAPAPRPFVYHATPPPWESSTTLS